MKAGDRIRFKKGVTGKPGRREITTIFCVLDEDSGLMRLKTPINGFNTAMERDLESAPRK